MRLLSAVLFSLLFSGMIFPAVVSAAPPLRMTVSPDSGDEPLVEDAIGQPCHVTKSGDKGGICRRDSDCVGDLLGTRPSSCIQPGGEEVLCCFPPSATGPGSPSGPSTSGSGPSSSSGSGAAACSGGGRTGSCVASCSSPSDLISPASGCATGQSCCAGAVAATGSGSGVGGGDITVPNPFGFTSLEAFLTTGILPWLQGVVVTLALVFFIIGALLYMTGGASEGNMKQGKAAMTASLIGLAIALAAPMFLKEVYNIFGVTASTGGPTLVGIALGVLRFLLSIIGILGTILLVVSGLSYMGSAGADDKAKSAKKMATYAVIGIALALAALIIIRQITKFFV